MSQQHESEGQPFANARAHHSGDISKLARDAMARLCDKKARRDARAAVAAPGPAGSSDACSDPVAIAIACALCETEEDAADALVEDLLNAGISVEELCVDHLAPAARRLGEWWASDRLPFAEVTLATARIQSILRRLPASRTSPVCHAAKGAVFVAVPGEEHTLGVMMAADLFRRNGWDVGLHLGQTHDALVGRLGRDDRPVIGLSCSGDHSFAALRRLMLALRKTRPDAHILLSGQIVGHQARLDDLPQPFTVVQNVADAEEQMTMIGEMLTAGRKGGSGHLRAVS